MIIAQTSDTHLNITTLGQLKVMFTNMSKENFDVLVHCGDYSGGSTGYKSVRPTVEMMRDKFPDKTIISVIGNHDLWSGKNSSLEKFYDNYEKIKEIFEENKIHFLDTDGIYVQDNIVFIGSSGWYTNPRPFTNDAKWMPIGVGGDTNSFLLNKAERLLFESEDQLNSIYTPDIKVVFVSHFPVINTEGDYKGSFADYSWSEFIGDYFKSKYECKYFLNGHSHAFHHGPLRYEAGADYRDPKYQLIEIK